MSRTFLPKEGDRAAQSKRFTLRAELVRSLLMMTWHLFITFNRAFPEQLPESIELLLLPVRFEALYQPIGHVSVYISKG